MCFPFVLVLAPAAAVVVTSGVYKKKPPTLQSWKQPFPSQRKQGGMRRRPASHEISHSNTRSKIPSEFWMCWLDGNQPLSQIGRNGKKVSAVERIQSCYWCRVLDPTVETAQPVWLPLHWGNTLQLTENTLTTHMTPTRNEMYCKLSVQG